jgi:beta-glucosidase
VARNAEPFMDSSLTLEERLDDLIGRLTLEEKCAQMQMDAPAITRLGIGAYHWWNEALHGVGRNGEATVFPQAIGMAASWDPELHHQMAKVIADEGRAKHAEAVRFGGASRQYAGLDFWSPNINIFRDPRWGRGQETYGEDPYLTSRMGVAFVRGLQGDDPYYFETIATPKHYAVHSGPEMERHRFNAEPSETDLFLTYLPAFEATVREGRAFSVMAAYNSVQGLPATASPRLLTDILRNQWGFQGYVTSDVDSVSDVYLSHGLVETPEAAAAASVKAGCDLNGGTTYRALAEAVRQGLLTEGDIDKSVRRLFTARFRLGEFDATPAADSDIPRNPYASIPATANDTREHDEVAHRMARESMVLLKNANNVLPLKKELRSIAVIGPTADSVIALRGNYFGNASKPITILQGIRDAVPLATQVLFTEGCPIVTEDIALGEPIPAACFYTDESKSRHGLTATYFRSVFSTDRPSRTRVDANVDLNFPDQSSRDSLPYTEGVYAKWSGVLVPPASGDYQIGFTGKDSFRLTIDGKVVVDEWFGGNRRSAGEPIHFEKDKAVSVLVEYAHPAAANAGGGGGGASQPAANAPRDTANVQLRWTRPTPEGLPAAASGMALYKDAVDAAKTADAVVVVLGITADFEREESAVHNVGFSGGDRTSLDLPLVQERMLEQVTAAAGNKPVVLVLTSGSALSVNWANDHVPAILQAWYPGQHGDAVADVLFGDYNPGGRLPVTFYKAVEDLPAFTSYGMQGRTYRYFEKPVLYPFGHGLSYTTFEYSDVKVPATPPSTTDDVVVTAKVKNTGARTGSEVVQCYINRPLPAGERERSETGPADLAYDFLAAQPRKTLVGFLRVPLEPGEQKTVAFTLTPHQLARVDGKGKRVLAKETLQVQVGGNSAAGATFPLTISGSDAPPEYRFAAPRVLQGDAQP